MKQEKVAQKNRDTLKSVPTYQSVSPDKFHCLFLLYIHYIIRHWLVLCNLNHSCMLASWSNYYKNATYHYLFFCGKP